VGPPPIRAMFVQPVSQGWVGAMVGG
jgi:hypothetical protein